MRSTSSTRTAASTTPSAAGGLLRASAETENARLRVRLPDGSIVDGEVELGEELETDFYGRPVQGRVVDGAVGTGSVGARWHTVDAGSG